ncbi:MAG: hypothetical protein HZC47_06500 [Methanobacterium sp.]|uniref:hypothetical protein n=1 Tax=Methanobacterium sp. TaxID=2164 RepID=UPI003D660E23|nr:hypothetical protein [Methanobacterium sp.]
MIKRTIVIAIISAVIIIMATAGSLSSTKSVEHSTLGSDNRGTVTKDVYNPQSETKFKIAIITGMHPREKVSMNVTSDAIKNYAQSNKVEIVHYKIAVNANLDYVRLGRLNGEGLVTDYVTPDISKSGYDLVIICHDHKKGYGDGYYVATPTMDAKSLALAEKFRAISPEYKYYQRDPEKKAKSKSISRVDAPIAASGTPLFIYEIPEWSGYQEAYDITYKLIDTGYKLA